MYFMSICPLAHNKIQGINLPGNHSILISNFHVKCENKYMLKLEYNKFPRKVSV